MGIQDIFGGFRSSALATVGGQEISAAIQRFIPPGLAKSGPATGQNLTAEDARKMGIDRSILNNLIQSAAIDAQAANLCSVFPADCRRSQG
jgi:peptidyl-prolyl cis-trans isomerase D